MFLMIILFVFFAFFHFWHFSKMYFVYKQYVFVFKMHHLLHVLFYDCFKGFPPSLGLPGLQKHMFLMILHFRFLHFFIFLAFFIFAILGSLNKRDIPLWGIKILSPTRRVPHEGGGGFIACRAFRQAYWIKPTVARPLLRPSRVRQKPNIRWKWTKMHARILNTCAKFIENGEGVRLYGLELRPSLARQEFKAIENLDKILCKSL